MDRERKEPLGLRVLGMLAIFTGLATLIAVGLYLIGYYVFAAIIGTAVSALYALLIVLITAHVTRRNTIETMERGAEIALKAQQINDTWDAKKTASAVTAVREGVKLGVSTSSRPPNVPALPLPSQAGDWIPPLESMPTLDASFFEE
jgi:hypothetical protein